MENMIVMPITKRTVITMSIQVRLISQMNFDYTKNGGMKAFSANPKIHIVYPKMKNMIVVPITKGMEINLSIHVCRISQMNFDHNENGSFFANPKHQYSASQCGEHDCLANSKKNGDYYGYQSLSHFTDNL